MLLTQDPETGYWVTFQLGGYLSTHDPKQCATELCDVHNRRGKGKQATWPLYWRGGMEVLCPHGVGHPTPAQVKYFEKTNQLIEAIHGCCGCCENYEED